LCTDSYISKIAIKSSLDEMFQQVIVTGILKYVKYQWILSHSCDCVDTVIIGETLKKFDIIVFTAKNGYIQSEI
jgi:hypothetical protein